MGGMPRPTVVSPDELVDALMRVVAGRGLDVVSMRTVAAEAGVSTGAVQNRFATKDALLRAAYERVIDQFAERVAHHAALGLTPRAFRRALLLELLPLDAQREAELRVAMAFTARSMHSPPLTRLYTHGYERLVAAVETTLEGDDPRRDARAAVAVADGLAWHMLCAPAAIGPNQAVAALDAHLAML